MATLRYVALVALAACGKLDGFGGPTPPLASFTVQVDGSVPAGADLHVAFVWGRQWLVEPLCIVPIDPRDDAQKVMAVIAAGCRDPFGLVPALVDTNIAVEPGVPAELDLFTLPSADVMVGDLTARVAYASFVAYSDGNGNGLLDLASPNRPPEREGPGNQLPTMTTDTVYGGSFVAMTRPDQRAAFREGAFIQSGFYPRAGCGDPPPKFSVLAASGFTAQDALTATLAGTVPQESDLSQCAQSSPADAVVEFALQNPPSRDVKELACTERLTDSTVRYREPPGDPLDLSNREWACVHYPSFGDPSDIIELVVTGTGDDACVGLTHYILKGCREGPTCGSPDWDDAPPSWWPC